MFFHLECKRCHLGGAIQASQSEILVDPWVVVPPRHSFCSGRKKSFVRIQITFTEHLGLVCAS